MLQKSCEKLRKVANEYYCEICDYRCSNLFNFNKHCSTRKHKEVTNVTNIKSDEKDTLVCSHCAKKYTSRMGLWRHSKICKPAEVKRTEPQSGSKRFIDSTSRIFEENPTLNENENISMVILDDASQQPPIQNYIMQLLEQNKEFKQTIMDQSNKMMELAQNQNTTINNKITNNTQFNLNVFLQQTCKDAINMSDFIDSLEINTKSLERTGTHGYVHGISKIFMDGIRKLKVQERPIHCTDLKREVLYIKDNDTWTKDTEDNKQFKKALATVVHRNMIQIVKWEEENPETSNPESKTYEFYFELARQSMGGGDQDVTDRNNDKILKAIAHEVHIDRKVKELI